MNSTAHQVAGALLALGLAAGAHAAPIDFHGYFRAGQATNAKGGSGVCYWLNQDKGVTMGFFRLGNECDLYGTFDLGVNVGEVNGVKFRTVTNFAYGTQELANWEQSVPAWRQLYGEAVGVGSGALEHASLWAGKRFYGYKDFHMMDYTWWEVNTGPGAGIDGVDTGFGKLALAVLWTGDQSWGNQTDTSLGQYRPGLVNGGAASAITADVRLNEVPLYPGGTLTLGADVVFSSVRPIADGGTAPDTKNGVCATAQWTHQLLGGDNNLVFQYATGAANLNGSASVGFNGDASGWRIMDQLVVQPSGVPFTGALVAGYQQFGGADKTKAFTIGIRPQYHFTEVYSLAAEIGHQRLTLPGASERALTKATLAAQASLGKSFWSRPALRVYATYAAWNDAARAAGVACTGRDCATSVPGFESSNGGASFGAQVEAWF